MNQDAKTSRFFGGAAVLTVTIFGFVAGAQAQVSDAQRSAIRSSCRSDFMANCSSVTPGGAEAFQCLMRNESKLSPACKSAVSSIAASEKAAEKPPAAAPTAAPAAATSPASEKPAPAKPAAASKPTTASAPAASGTQQPAKRPPAAAPKATTAAAPAADAGPPPPPPPPNWTQIPPRYELQVVRSCRPEVQTICALPAGGGRILNCLATNQANVSPSCSAALDRARAAAVQ